MEAKIALVRKPLWREMLIKVKIFTKIEKGWKLMNQSPTLLL